jgi:catechol 2,3-dioxygenase-like lactoylglutathione lyase family enzyme
MVLGSFAAVCVADVAGSVRFYCDLLGLVVVVDHGWYAELGIGVATLVAFVTTGHETVPEVAGARPSGLLLSFEVAEVGPIYEAVIGRGWPVLVDLVVELGQKHFMVVDPDGAVIDVIERVPLASDDRRRLVRLRRQRV